MVEVIKPVLGEKMVHFSSGTGGFLVPALNALEKQVGNPLENREIDNNSVYGVEKKALLHSIYPFRFLEAYWVFFYYRKFCMNSLTSEDCGIYNDVNNVVIMIVKEN